MDPGSSDNKVLFKIEDEEYTKTDLQPYLAYFSTYTSVSENEAVKSIYDRMLTKKAAENLGIAVPQDKVAEQIKTLITDSKAKEINLESYEEYLDLFAYDLVLAQLSQATFINESKGHYLIFWFGDKFIETYETNPEGFGDENLIADDKKYAKELAETIYDQLKNNKITIEEAIKVTNEQNRTDSLAYISGSFGEDSTRTWQQSVPFSDIATYIEGIETGLSEIQLGRTGLNPVTENKEDYVDAYYYVVSKDSGGETQALAEKLEQEKGNLKASIYVD